MKDNKGFTLIELLAVIIILGILMIIAIPSVTTYISDSRKSAYVDTAKEIVNGAGSIVNEGKLKMYDTATTYYIPSSYVKTENSSKSPYGDFVQAYVGVIYDGNGYEYYWISVDEAGQGVEEVKLIDNLDTKDIKSNVIPDDIEHMVKTTGIGNRTGIAILNPDTGEWEIYNATDHVSENGSDSSQISYPEGKEKSTLAVGDMVSIGDQDFYVMKNTGDKVYLLARYNLYVGTVTDEHWNFVRNITSDEEGYGRQKEIAKAWHDGDHYMYGIIPFSNESYWTITDDPWAFVYSNKSLIKHYVDSYANSLGITYKEARVMDYHEAEELGCNGDNNCYNAQSFVRGVSYWLGNACGTGYIGIISDDGYYSCYGYANDYFFGIRPVIVI